MSWRLAHALDQLRTEVRTRWPDTTVWTIGDSEHASRSSDHNPNPAGVVCAIDVVGARQAGHLWAQLLADRDDRIAYLIHRGRIVSSTTLPWTVQPYRGPNPHTNHIHVSVGRGPDGRKARPDLYDDRTPWGVHDQEDDDVQVVRYGDRGPRVRRVQVILNAAGRNGLGEELLPRHGADGHYGAETAAAVDRIAERAGLDPTGKVGMDVLVLDYCRMLLEAARTSA